MLKRIFSVVKEFAIIFITAIFVGCLAFLMVMSELAHNKPTDCNDED